jgi:hypothetical protein
MTASKAAFAAWPPALAFSGVPGTHPRRLPDGRIILIRRKGACHSGRTGGTQRASLSGQRPPPHEDRSGKRNAGQCPPVTGRALAGGDGPRLVLMPAQRCGRGDCPCH